MKLILFCLWFKSFQSFSQKYTNIKPYNNKKESNPLKNAIKNAVTVIPFKNIYPDTKAYLETDVKVLNDITLEYFKNPGKQIRFIIVFLLGKILNVSYSQVYPLALSTEMIHTASLIHDDILDDSNFRRGKLTLYKKFTTKSAVLGGDFLLAKASVLLASTQNQQVQLCMSNALACLVEGELIQCNLDSEMSTYLHKTYCKTSSLFMNSCTSVGILSSNITNATDNAEHFGYHFGMAFQLLDDIEDLLYGDDIMQGIITAPYIYARNRDPSIRKLFKKRKWLRSSRLIKKKIRELDGIKYTKNSLLYHVDRALFYLDNFAGGIEKELLWNITLGLTFC